MSIRNGILTNQIFIKFKVPMCKVSSIYIGLVSVLVNWYISLAIKAYTYIFISIAKTLNVVKSNRSNFLFSLGAHAPAELEI